MLWIDNDGWSDISLDEHVTCKKTLVLSASPYCQSMYKNRQTSELPNEAKSSQAASAPSAFFFLVQLGFS